MSITLDQAIASLVKAAIPITITNVLSAYLRIVGVSKEGTVEEGTIIAFEHALDKYPIPIPQRNRIQNSVCDASFLKFIRPYTVQVAQVRKEYWKEKLGCVNASRCTCTGCGKTVRYELENDQQRGEAEAKYPRKAIKRKPLKKRKIVKSASCDVTRDLYGSSSGSTTIIRRQ